MRTASHGTTGLVDVDQSIELLSLSSKITVRALALTVPHLPARHSSTRPDPVCGTLAPSTSRTAPSALPAGRDKADRTEVGAKGEHGQHGQQGYWQGRQDGWRGTEQVASKDFRAKSRYCGER